MGRLKLTAVDHPHPTTLPQTSLPGKRHLRCQAVSESNDSLLRGLKLFLADFTRPRELSKVDELIDI